MSRTPQKTKKPKRPKPASVTKFYTTSSGKRKNNCYSYAFGMRGGVQNVKPQPGSVRSNRHSPLSDRLGCRAIVNRVLKDLGGAVRRKPKGRSCARTENEVALYLSGEAPLDRDYHFYLRKAGEFFWSHKRGLGDVFTGDCKARQISDPDAACRRYAASGGHDYVTPCARFCHKPKRRLVMSVPTSSSRRKKKKNSTEGRGVKRSKKK